MTQLFEQEADVKTMLAAYTGPFLDNLIVDDAPLFTDWQYTQQEIFR